MHVQTNRFHTQNTAHLKRHGLILQREQERGASTAASHSWLPLPRPLRRTEQRSEVESSGAPSLRCFVSEEDTRGAQRSKGAPGPQMTNQGEGAPRPQSAVRVTPPSPN